MTNTEQELLTHLVKALGILERAPASGAFSDALDAVYHPAVALVHRLDPSTIGRWMFDTAGLTDIPDSADASDAYLTRPPDEEGIDLATDYVGPCRGGDAEGRMPY